MQTILGAVLRVRLQGRGSLRTTLPQLCYIRRRELLMPTQGLDPPVAFGCSENHSRSMYLVSTLSWDQN